MDVLDVLLVKSFPTNSFASTFIVTNNCPQTIWLGTLAGSKTPQLSTTGFKLDSGQSVRIPAFPGWPGVGTCQTGDCGGRLECDGVGAHHLRLSLRSQWAPHCGMVIIFLSLLPHKGCLEYAMPPNVFQTLTQVAQKSFRWLMGTMVEWEWLDARVHVRHLG
ncbi:hypothetical protein CsSME_00042858 [Camellia sinensis var. sinensis]